MRFVSLFRLFIPVHWLLCTFVSRGRKLFFFRSKRMLSLKTNKNHRKNLSHIPLCPILVPPTQVGQDPLTETGYVFAQDYVFAELLDIAYEPQEELVWSVGQGGLMVFDVSDPTEPEFMATYSPLGGTSERIISRWMARSECLSAIGSTDGLPTTYEILAGKCW